MKMAEEILSQYTGLTINDEDAYIIYIKTENALKAMEEYSNQQTAYLQKEVEELKKKNTCGICGDGIIVDLTEYEQLKKVSEKMLHALRSSVICLELEGYKPSSALMKYNNEALNAYNQLNK